MQAPLPLAVKIVEAEDQAAGRCRKLFGDPPDLLDMPGDGRDTGEDDRIVAPNHPLRAESLGQLAKGGDPLGQRRHVRFIGFIVRVESELKIVVKPAPLQLIQVRQQWPRVFGPEADGVHMGGIEAESGDLVAVEGVDPVKKAGADAVHEPFAVEGGDIGAPTGGRRSWLGQGPGGFQHISGFNQSKLVGGFKPGLILSALFIFASR